jgi:hypothetical protein
MSYELSESLKKLSEIGFKEVNRRIELMLKQWEKEDKSR